MNGQNINDDTQLKAFCLLTLSKKKKKEGEGIIFASKTVHATLEKCVALRFKW